MEQLVQISQIKILLWKNDIHTKGKDSCVDAVFHDILKKYSTALGMIDFSKKYFISITACGMSIVNPQILQ